MTAIETVNSPHTVSTTAIVVGAQVLVEAQRLAMRGQGTCYDYIHYVCTGFTPDGEPVWVSPDGTRRVSVNLNSHSIQPVKGITA